MYYHCRVCGKRTSHSSWPWNVCEDCEPYQQAVIALAEQYQGEIPEAALKALTDSLKQYDEHTGELVSETKAAPLRTALAYSRRSAFRGALRLPSMTYVDVSSLYRSALILLLDSGFLPARLADEVRAYLDEIEQRKQRLTRIVTYQSAQQWHACLLDGNLEKEPPVSGTSEGEALDKLYARHPELGSLTA